jgi:hypothetical protein
MSPFAGPLFAAAALLAAAGVAKVATPAATRVALRSAGLPSSAPAARALGAIELAIAAAALAIGGRVPAALTAAAYLGFAWFARRLDRATRGTASCGCFGASSAPVGTVHIAFDLATAVLLVGAVANPAAGIATAIDDTPWSGAPFLALTALLTWMAYVSLTILPATLAAGRRSPA